MTSPAREFIPVHVAVLTVSDTRTLETDTSGRLAVDRHARVDAGQMIAARLSPVASAGSAA